VAIFHSLSAWVDSRGRIGVADERPWARPSIIRPSCAACRGLSLHRGATREISTRDQALCGRESVDAGRRQRNGAGAGAAPRRPPRAAEFVILGRVAAGPEGISPSSAASSSFWQRGVEDRLTFLRGSAGQLAGGPSSSDTPRSAISRCSLVSRAASDYSSAIGCCTHARDLPERPAGRGTALPVTAS